MRCYRYSKSPFSTRGVRCVDDKRRYSEDETSTFAESAPPSCGYLHISISSAQHRGCRRRAARTQTLANTLSYILARTHIHTDSHTFALSTFPFYARARVPLSVCAHVYVCVCVCCEDPAEKIPLSWTTITTPEYRERCAHRCARSSHLGVLLRFYVESTHIRIAHIRDVGARDTYTNSSKRFSVPPRLYYLCASLL